MSLCDPRDGKVTLNWISSKENALMGRRFLLFVCSFVFIKMKMASRLPTNRKVFRKKINVTTYCINEEKQIAAFGSHPVWLMVHLTVICVLFCPGEILIFQ